MTLAWLAGLTCPVINRPDAALWYRAGAPLFAWRALLRGCGLPLPEVVVTSDPAEARAFRCRLAARRRRGAVYTPLTAAAGYLLADDDAWERLATLQARAPVCLSEPHGAASLACIVGDAVIWDGACRPRRSTSNRGCRALPQQAHLDFCRGRRRARSRRPRRGDGRSRCRVLEHFALATSRPHPRRPRRAAYAGTGRRPRGSRVLSMILVCGGLADGVTELGVFPVAGTAAIPTACSTSPAFPRTTGSPGGGRTAARRAGSPPPTGGSISMRSAASTSGSSGRRIARRCPVSTLPTRRRSGRERPRSDGAARGPPMPGGQPHRRRALQQPKPYQALVISGTGLRVPPTLVTSDPAAARAFHAEHGEVIYKSASGIRSIVRRLGPDHACASRSAVRRPGAVPGVRSRPQRPRAHCRRPDLRHPDRVRGGGLPLRPCSTGSTSSSRRSTLPATVEAACLRARPRRSTSSSPGST